MNPILEARKKVNEEKRDKRKRRIELDREILSRLNKTKYPNGNRT